MAAQAETVTAAASAVDAAPAGGPALRLAAAAGAVAPGEVSAVTLTGASGLAGLSTLELTLEWDPAVVEVTGIAPGPWKSAEDAGTLRFEADRTAGRAHLHFTRAGEGGLPDGVLATLAVKAAGPGTTLVRATAGAAATANGTVTAPAVEAAPFTVKPAS
jgi:hypothetical protein